MPDKIDMSDDPAYREALAELLTESVCPHCATEDELIPAAGGRFVLGIKHQVGCPARDDYEQ